MIWSTNQFKVTFTNHYELLRWIISVFVGGSFNSLIYFVYRGVYYNIKAQYPIPPNTTATFSLSDPFIQTVLNVIPPTLILFSITLALSFILTKLNGDKKLVPPLFMQSITFGWFLFAIVIPSKSTDIVFELMMFGMYVYVAGIIQDKIMITLLGYSGRFTMNKHSLLVNTSLESLKEIFLEKDYRTNLGLARKPKIITGGFRFVSAKKYNVSTIIDVKIVQSEKDNQRCSINIVVFEKGSYEVSTDHTEYLNKQIDIIRGKLDRKQIKYGDNEDLTHVEQTVNDASNQLRGVSHHLDKLTSFGWVRVAAFVAILGIMGYLFYDMESMEGVLGVVILFLLYIVFETRGFKEQP